MSTTAHAAPEADIKQVPRTREERAAIRQVAAELAIGMDHTRPPKREELEAQGRAMLERLALPPAYLGFAMVAASNAFWRPQFAAIPYARRLFLLPNCLRNQAACAGSFDTIGLHCAGCGACSIFDLQGQAEGLGYEVVVAEGTTSVIMKVLEGAADGILGVACMDSLEKSFNRIVDLGIPNLAVPLLGDGCVDTEAELDEILAMMRVSEAGKAETRSYLPLLRETMHCFEESSLRTLLGPYISPEAWTPGEEDDPLIGMERIAVDWLRDGGKRLRPFVTAAAYAVATHGLEALAPEAEVTSMVSQSVRRLALCIEVMHKASLVHDDVMDDDAYRYGRETLHRSHGIGQAIIIGDYLIGLGYRLVAGEARALGAACVADIQNALTTAHLDLCRGQGAEVLWQRRGDGYSPLDMLNVYALKTAPAFEVALYAGLRAAGADIDPALLKRFAIYVGEGFQVLNDLEDWQGDAGNKVMLGQDVLAGRPTVLQAFALEAGAEAALASARQVPAEAAVARVQEAYAAYGVFDRAARLADKLRERSLLVAHEVEDEALAELLDFLARVILQDRTPAGHGA